MRCPDCNKFVSMEFVEPEANLEVSVDLADDNVPIYSVTGTVTITRQCTECGTDLKTAELEVDQAVYQGEGLEAHELEAVKTLVASGTFDAEDADLEDDAVEPLEEGGGRYAKSFFGASATFEVTVQGVVVARVEWSDKVAASEMEEV